MNRTYPDGPLRDARLSARITQAQLRKLLRIQKREGLRTTSDAVAWLIEREVPGQGRRTK